MRFGGYGFGGYAAQNPAMGPDPEIEKQALKAQVNALEAELEFIKKRLSGMERGGRGRVSGPCGADGLSYGQPSRTGTRGLAEQ